MAAATAFATLSISPAPAETGRIQGAIRFPGCTLPEDLEVCAREVDSSAPEICRSTPGNRYALQLPPGTYFVYSRSESLDRVAYYDRAVVCGLRSKCGDFRPIPVTVTPGSDLENIDPADWFGPAPALDPAPNI